MKARRVILTAGLIAGALDLTGAFVVSWLRSGVGPQRVMQSIASGLLGQAAYDGGAATAALGVPLHFFIATSWATIFYFASRQIRVLVDQWFVSGFLYGIFVYSFMNFVVLPLSRFPMRGTPTLTGRLIGCSIIVVCIGIPIAAICRRGR